MKSKYIIGAIILISVFCVVSCEAEKGADIVESVTKMIYTEINPFEKLQVSISGIDTYGKVELDVSECDEFTKEHIDFVLDINLLKNGDTLSVTATYDPAEAEKQLYKITLDTMEYTVTGLREIQYIDPFDGLEVTYSGKSPNGTIELDNSACPSEITDYVTYTYPEKVANDEVITICVILDDGITEQKGIALSATEKEYTVSGLFTPLSITFDKQKFLDVMNNIVIDDSFTMYSFYLVDLNFDDIPELIAQYSSSMGGSFNIYDIYDLAERSDTRLGYNFLSSDTTMVEFKHYINTDTNEFICIADEYWRDYENDYMVRDISELILTGGKISANTEHGLSKIKVFSIPSNWFAEDTSNENVMELYVNTDITNAKTIDEYYSYNHEITLPRSESFYMFEKGDNILKALTDSYIESCEAFSQIESEYYTYNVINTTSNTLMNEQYMESLEKIIELDLSSFGLYKYTFIDIDFDGIPEVLWEYIGQIWEFGFRDLLSGESSFISESIKGEDWAYYIRSGIRDIFLKKTENDEKHFYIEYLYVLNGGSGSDEGISLIDVQTNENGMKSILYTRIAYCVDMRDTKTYKIFNENTDTYTEVDETTYIKYIGDFKEMDSIEYISTETEFAISPSSGKIMNGDESSETYDSEQMKLLKESIINVANEYFTIEIIND